MNFGIGIGAITLLQEPKLHFQVSTYVYGYGVLLKPALKYAIADVDSLDQFLLLSDDRLENLKLKIVFHNYLKLLSIWIGIGI